MKHKAGWFCIVMAAYFVVMAFVERGIYNDELGAVAAGVCAVSMGVASMIILKVDELIDIRMLEYRIVRKLLRERES